MNLKQTGKPLVLSLMVGLMFLLTACPGDTVPSTPPTAANDTYDVVEGQPRTVAAPGVLSNDGGEDLQAALVTNVAAGTLNLETNGSFTYTPTGAAGTTDSFTYTASNSAGTSDAATVTLNITEPDDNGGDPMPGTLTAQNDSLPRVAPGGTLDFTNADLTGNDTIPTGVTPTVTINQSSLEAGEGTITPGATAGTYTYTAPATATTATFTYTLSADNFEDSTATVTIPVGEAPPAGEGPYNVNFQSQDAPAPPADYLVDFGEPFGARAGTNQGTNQSYGWVTLDGGNATTTGCTIVGNGRYRTTAGAGIDVEDVEPPTEVLYQTFMHMEGADAAALNVNNNNQFTGVAQNCAWQIAVPNGVYNVTVALGDAATDSNMQVRNGTTYQVSVDGTSFPDTPYAPYDNSVPGNGSSELFVVTEEPLEVTVNDGLLTITPTGTNTKIAFVSIVAAGGEEED